MTKPSSNESQELPKAYDPSALEGELYEQWERSGAFKPSDPPAGGGTGETFSIVLPPPNVTGRLHTGHSMMLAVEDAMVRFHRMRGDRTVWIPGLDHAAIATHSVVERELWKTEKKSRHDLGREAFLERIHAFVDESRATITGQVRKMGASLDWERLAFTLDAPRHDAVTTAFLRMYEAGLIYRGDRIVNWDPRMQTTVSDDEVDRVEQTDTFYYLKYGPFTIATARPETKFGDKYVVMHPDDERYAEYRDGQTIELEWINGPITATIIKDKAIDPEFGTGVMTITPWHDMVDFEIAERHGLDKEQIIDDRGRLLKVAGEFVGMKIAEARPQIIEKLRAKGLVVKEDPTYRHAIATNSRGGGTIEPQIKRQWFVDVNKIFPMPHSAMEGIATGQKVSLKSLMNHAVKSGQTTILPDRFSKVYFHWIEHLRDWCISRQIWYGHRIPAWYHDTCQARDETGLSQYNEPAYVGAPPAKGEITCKNCRLTYSLEHYSQDEDTLDTWFSSGLWTFSTLGWPDAMKGNKKTGELAEFHPTSVLETGYDILFFWVARMILMSTYFMGEVPFKTVYLHGLVRDAQGRKMSKSLGNIVDPLTLIDEYGADALRMALLFGSGAGSDVNLGNEKLIGMRRFANKLWNIARFIRMRTEGFVDPKPLADLEPKTDADRDILAKLNETIEGMTDEMERYQFHLAAERIYHFVWHEFADVYLEASKPQLDDAATKESTTQILHAVLRTSLTLLHPFMPFITEGIWQSLPKPSGDSQLLITQSWPQ